ncbi:MAG: hypothetical protein EA377_13140, partial [Phycisphaerales bacterium]
MEVENPPTTTTHQQKKDHELTLQGVDVVDRNTHSSFSESNLSESDLKIELQSTMPHTRTQTVRPGGRWVRMDECTIQWFNRLNSTPTNRPDSSIISLTQKGTTMIKSFTIIGLMCVIMLASTCLSGCATAPRTEMDRERLVNNAQVAVSEFTEKDPGMAELF